MTTFAVADPSYVITSCATGRRRLTESVTVTVIQRMIVPALGYGGWLGSGAHRNHDAGDVSPAERCAVSAIQDVPLVFSGRPRLRDLPLKCFLREPADRLAARLVDVALHAVAVRHSSDDRHRAGDGVGRTVDLRLRVPADIRA
jgi:hypothetical protein